MSTPRIKEIAGGDDETGPLLETLVELAVRGLPAVRTDAGDYVFTRRGTPDGKAEAIGRSLRYAAIVALGAGLLPIETQRAALAGETAYELTDRLVRTLTGTADAVPELGDAALICWAAAEAGHQDLPRALARLAELDPPDRPVYTVTAAWVVSALAAAKAVAERICALQGPAGQWWWHYDARTGQVVEGYPVYSVHQHAMAPMALLDLAEAGGTRHTAAIRTGLHWITAPAETGESLIDEELALVWRKVARNDPRKLVRGLRALSTRARLRLVPLDHVFPPTVVDRECRPYELGWLLYAW